LENIVLDTNILLVSFSSKSKVRWLFDALINQEFVLCVTTDILNEYAEIVERHMGFEASENLLNILENLSNVKFITNYFKFNLLNDVDDNKFVDCAIASNSSYIVTNDKDFNLLKKFISQK
jgi:uncharacterized protein